MNMKRGRSAWRKNVLIENIFAREGDGALQEIGTEKLWQVMRASLVFHIYEKGGRADWRAIDHGSQLLVSSGDVRDRKKVCAAGAGQ